MSYVKEMPWTVEEECYSETSPTSGDLNYMESVYVVKRDDGSTAVRISDIDYGEFAVFMAHWIAIFPDLVDACKAMLSYGISAPKRKRAFELMTSVMDRVDELEAYKIK